MSDGVRYFSRWKTRGESWIRGWCQSVLDVDTGNLGMGDGLTELRVRTWVVIIR